ncbi:hypothetical protein PTTG_29572 [Puccinia triticina 1-1 BBBD Race 1]|uniref:Uncharacterized protein n=2 Tax=Puccinia triticina TaxID=208348 RepID=A0A180G392_PUCT1|nr:uncharacterized protein PtA15_5A748 [Puccinia triticina]OAV87104.1 hypothetical protein PTTG_29572 [Puccinia triticina 1-1 BBBD Race 1]WAQ85174.1 hypothetical protein PtA15_5A748 [Puccinia triticina]WAR58512.1 hypothetical protein PtB15_5B746 [Puccinia triticina]
MGLALHGLGGEARHGDSKKPHLVSFLLAPSVAPVEKLTVPESLTVVQKLTAAPSPNSNIKTALSNPNTNLIPMEEINPNMAPINFPIAFQLSMVLYLTLIS